MRVWVSIWMLFMTGMVGCAVKQPARPGVRGAQRQPARPAPPFEAVHPMRGPGLILDDLRLVGEGGSFALSIGAFDHGRDIVFFMSRGPSSPIDGLTACPRSTKEPGTPRIRVVLEGVGDISRNTVYAGGGAWWTSIPVADYARLRTLRFDICGRRYALPVAHDPRLAQHVKLASEQARVKNRGDSALPGACEAGDGAACYKLGGLARERQEKRRLFERACALRDPDGCNRFASMLLDGHGGGKDPARALRLFKQTCEGGHDGACLELSRAVIRRPSAWPTPSAEGRYREGAALARRACELAGSTVAVSCLWAAKLHATGFGLPADPARVAAFAERSCRKDFEQACRLRRALVDCAEGSGEACVGIADTVHRGRYRGLKDDGSEAIWRWAACHRGHAASCAAIPR